MQGAGGDEGGTVRERSPSPSTSRKQMKTSAEGKEGDAADDGNAAGAGGSSDAASATASAWAAAAFGDPVEYMRLHSRDLAEQDWAAPSARALLVAKATSLFALITAGASATTSSSSEGEPPSREWKEALAEVAVLTVTAVNAAWERLADAGQVEGGDDNRTGTVAHEHWELFLSVLGATAFTCYPSSAAAEEYRQSTDNKAGVDIEQDPKYDLLGDQMDQLLFSITYRLSRENAGQLLERTAPFISANIGEDQPFQNRAAAVWANFQCLAYWVQASAPEPGNEAHVAEWKDAAREASAKM